MNSNGTPNLRIRDTPEQAAEACSDYILDTLARVLLSKPRAALALSGGSTPKLLFAAMARAKFAWSGVHIFWVDERCVPPTDAQSNYKLANDTLLTPAQIPEGNIHRIKGEIDPDDAARQYVAEIREFFELQEGAIPVFDVLHRGMGPDGHTASLFPGTRLVHDRAGIAAHVWIEKMKMDRITLLPAVLMAATSTVLQVAGAEKAEMVRNVLTGAVDFSKYPCQIASRDTNATWFLDEAAAARL